MPLIAITRQVSPNLNRCELSFHGREPIDMAKARAQHHDYEQCLKSLGAHVITLPTEPELPDSVFVEDAALVFDEVAVIPIMGAASRRDEPQSLVPTLSRYRTIEYLRPPASLDGGDVLVAGRRVFVGLTKRTNRDGVNQLREILEPHDYTVEGVPVCDVLHLKSACCHIGNNTLLINRRFVDAAAFEHFGLIEVPGREPGGANALLLGGTVILAASFGETRSLLESRGFDVLAVDVSELQKAEAGVTCCSVIFMERNGD